MSNRRYRRAIERADKRRRGRHRHTDAARARVFLLTVRPEAPADEAEAEEITSALIASLAIVADWSRTRAAEAIHTAGKELREMIEAAEAAGELDAELGAVADAEPVEPAE